MLRCWPLGGIALPAPTCPALPRPAPPCSALLRLAPPCSALLSVAMPRLLTQVPRRIDSPTLPAVCHTSDRLDWPTAAGLPLSDRRRSHALPADGSAKLDRPHVQAAARGSAFGFDGTHLCSDGGLRQERSRPQAAQRPILHRRPEWAHGVSRVWSLPRRGRAGEGASCGYGLRSERVRKGNSD